MGKKEVMIPTSKVLESLGINHPSMGLVFSRHSFLPVLLGTHTLRENFPIWASQLSQHLSTSTSPGLGEDLETVAKVKGKGRSG